VFEPTTPSNEVEKSDDTGLLSELDSVLGFVVLDKET